MSKQRIDRTVLIGLDGATFSILDPLMESRTLPFLREFAGRGVRGILRSTIPPITPIAWTTIATGRTAGNHGIFDFVHVDRDSGRLTYTLVASTDVQCETVWSMASRQGGRVAALNFPCTFPAPQVNGFVVPGYVPWSYMGRAIYPRDLYPRLKALPGFKANELAVDWDVERKAVQGLPEEELEGWVRFHIAREKQWFEITRYLLSEEPCDLFTVIFDGVDRLQHLCYHLIDPRHAHLITTSIAKHVRGLCLEYFRQVDDYIRQIVTLAGPDARIFIVSDHGFGLAGDQIFYANTWLEQHGYLAWSDGIAQDNRGRVALDDNTESGVLFDWTRTKACALTSITNGIFIQQASSPEGPGVQPDEYYAFREGLKNSLLEYKDPYSGLPVVERVLIREEAYPGLQMERAPDLTLVLHDRSFLSILRADSPLRPRPSPYGTHFIDGIFFGAGPGIRAGEWIEPLSVTDITPTLLYSLGLPLPVDLEGAPPVQAFEAEFIAARPLQRHAPGVPSIPVAALADGARLPDQEEAVIMDRLRALGYLD